MISKLVQIRPFAALTATFKKRGVLGGALALKSHNSMILFALGRQDSVYTVFFYEQDDLGSM